MQVLPAGYLNQTVVSESPMTLVTAIGICQSLGYLTAKCIAVWTISSAFFFRHRSASLDPTFFSDHNLDMDT